MDCGARTPSPSVVEVSLVGLVEVHGVGPALLAGGREAEQVAAPHGVAGEGQAALGPPAPGLALLLEQAGPGRERRSEAGRVEAGATLALCHLRPTGGDAERNTGLGR